MRTLTKTHGFSDVASDAQEKMSADLELLKEAFAQFRKDVAHMVGDAGGVGKSTAVRAIQSAKSRLEDLKDAGGDQVEAVEKRIAAHPLASASIALGVGILVAKILSFRK